METSPLLAHRSERPEQTEYAPYYAGYMARVPAGDILGILRREAEATVRLLSTPLARARANHRYAPGKWTVREVLGHVCDAERVFAYRALRIARGDGTPLAGFDENAYVPAGEFETRSLDDLVSEFVAVRGATLALFAGLPPASWKRRGSANEAVFSVRGTACIIAGHELHHRSLLMERYGLSAAGV